METWKLSATDVIKALKSGAVSRESVLADQQDRIDRCNKDINAIIGKRDVMADEGPAADSLLGGLPVSTKDQIHIAGQVCTFGEPKFANFKPDRNAPLIDNLLKAGATLGQRTNLPPFAMDFQCYNDLHGVTSNPWNRAYTSGGSTGGAAAVAAGMSWLEIGTDLAGSLRIPASFCGVFSLLPGEGVLPNDGMLADENLAPLPHFARPGPVARHARDLLPGWQALNGETRPVTQDKISLSEITVKWGGATKDMPVDPEIHTTVAGFADRMSMGGAHVENTMPTDVDFAVARRLFAEILGHDTGVFLNPVTRFVARMAGKAGGRRSPHFVGNVLTGYARNKARYHRNLEQRKILQEKIATFIGKDGIWVLPVTATPCFTHRKADADHGGSRDYVKGFMINDVEVGYFDALTAFTSIAGVTGFPVVTMPVGVDARGLPIGVQLVGRPGDETRLIAVADVLSDLVDMPVCPAMV